MSSDPSAIQNDRINLYWIDLSRFDTKINKSPWLEMGEILSNNGFNVTLLCGFEKTRYRPAGYKINIKYFRSLSFGGLFRYTLLIGMIAWLILKARTRDVLIVRPGSLIAGLIIKYARGCHLHMDVRTVPVEVHTLRDKIDRLLFWKLPLKYLRKMPDSYSFITEPLKEAIEAEFRDKYDDYVIWHSAVNVSLFETQVLNSDRGESDTDKFVLFYHGTITPNRGIELVIKAISSLGPPARDNVVFRIVGRGAYVDHLRSLVSALGLGDKVRFEGYVPYDRIPEAIRDSDCCICPLPNRPEWNVSSPIKVFEYLACGKPIILTPIPAHRSILDNHNFVIWTEGDRIEDYAKAIDHVYRNRKQLINYADQAIEIARQKYDWSAQGNKLADYLHARFKQ
mgnify:FL=1